MAEQALTITEYTPIVIEATDVGFDEGQFLISLYPSGVTLAYRKSPWATWGPPARPAQ